MLISSYSLCSRGPYINDLKNEDNETYDKMRGIFTLCVCVHVCASVCVCERERERKRDYLVTTQKYLLILTQAKLINPRLTVSFS